MVSRGHSNVPYLNGLCGESIRPANRLRVWLPLPSVSQRTRPLPSRRAVLLRSWAGWHTQLMQIEDMLDGVTAVNYSVPQLYLGCRGRYPDCFVEPMSSFLVSSRKTFAPIFLRNKPLIFPGRKEQKESRVVKVWARPAEMTKTDYSCINNELLSSIR